MSFSIMTTNHLKLGIQPIPEMSCISNTSYTVSNVQHNTDIMNQSLSQIFRNSLDVVYYTCPVVCNHF
jgi:hypothetical protein